MNVIGETKNTLRSHFDRKDFGEANFILGIKITRTCDGIFLDQSHYVEKILKKYNFLDCKHVVTLFDSSVHLFPVESENNVINQKKYASLIGSLRYLTDCTRLDIAYAVGVLSKFTSKPGNEHWYCIHLIGIYEALELRDGGSDYLGKGASKAVNNVNSIIGPALIGKDPTDQTGLDNYMVHQLDGTQNEWGWCKQKLGANAILAVSLAVCKAGAAVKNIPLYKEFMILPVGASSFKEAMQMGCEVYHHLKVSHSCSSFYSLNICLFQSQALRMICSFLFLFLILSSIGLENVVAFYFTSEAVIKKNYGQDATNVGDEGGFAPNIQNKEGLELLKTAIDKAGYTGKNNNGSQKISGDQLKDLYKSFVSEYPIVSIEDPFDQDDWETYAKLTAEIGAKVQIVGDDLLVTNPKRVAKAISGKTCNALLLKVNQIGSVTESIEAVKMSKPPQLVNDLWGICCSGETEDTFIADLAVGLSTGQIKTGAPCRSEGLAKYNQLLRIEEELGADAVYAGASFRAPVEPY
ncbi:Enolase [Capsicum baccatum]|uniref:phosphopyruvate hydratase n=1 Tax=Capsicum baccatum TaxID=33114 RepID=A0A2G2VU76_CAPBA|nr:Enolase [Capsicum baccatum]